MPKNPMDDAHVLIPPELANDLPLLYATEQELDSLARVKFFTPDSSWTWYVVYAARSINDIMPRFRLCRRTSLGIVEFH